jgi:hypothetical protein
MELGTKNHCAGEAQQQFSSQRTDYAPSAMETWLRHHQLVTYTVTSSLDSY